MVGRLMMRLDGEPGRFPPPRPHSRKGPGPDGGLALQISYLRFSSASSAARRRSSALG